MGKATPLLLKLPVLSVAGYKGFVQRVENVLHREEFAVVTHLEIEADAKAQYKITFTPDSAVEDPAVGHAIITQREAIQEALVSFPDPSEAEDATATRQPRGHGGPNRKAQAPRRAAPKKKVAKKKAPVRRKF